jgi:hypothetical protein
MDENIDELRALPGFERGHPHYFKDPVIDHLLEIVLQLGAELWVNRDRQMVIEHLLANEGQVTPDMIDAFEPPEDFAQRQREQRQAMMQRVYGCLYEGLDTDAGNRFVPSVIIEK